MSRNTHHFKLIVHERRDYQTCMYEKRYGRAQSVESIRCARNRLGHPGVCFMKVQDRSQWDDCIADQT